MKEPIFLYFIIKLVWHCLRSYKNEVNMFLAYLERQNFVSKVL